MASRHTVLASHSLTIRVDAQELGALVHVRIKLQISRTSLAVMIPAAAAAGRLVADKPFVKDFFDGHEPSPLPIEVYK